MDIADHTIWNIEILYREMNSPIKHFMPKQRPCKRKD